MNNMTMGLGIDTDIPYGLVGVGYALNEAIVGNTQSATAAYPNLPVNMVSAGLINTVAYSLWLNDLGKFQEIRLTALDSNKQQTQAQVTSSLVASTPRNMREI